MMLSIGVQVASLRLPLKQALPRIAEMGAKGVEIDARGELNPRALTQTGLRQVKKWIDDYGLKVCAVTFRTRRGYDVDDDLHARIEATKQAMSFAYTLGAPVVVNQIGRIDASQQDAPGWTRLQEAMTDLGRYGQRVGAMLAMETGTESGEDMKAFIQALPEGCGAVNFDPGNLIVNGFSASDAVRQLGPYIHHIHAKDGVRDLARGRGLEVPLGRGTADFPELIGVMSEFNYHGFWTIEREDSANPLQEIAWAVEFLQNM